MHRKVRKDIELLLTRQVFVKKHTFPSSRPEGSLHLSKRVIRERMSSAPKSGLCERNHCDTTSRTWATFGNPVTNMMPLHKAEKTKVTWYARQGCAANVGDIPIQTAATRLLSVGKCGILAPFGSLKSILVVTYAKLLRQCMKLSHSDTVRKAFNSVLQTYIP